MQDRTDPEADAATNCAADAATNPQANACASDAQANA